MLYLFTVIADLITFDILQLPEAATWTAVVHFFIEDLLKIFCLTAVIVFIMGLFKHEFGSEQIKQYLSGKSKIVAYLLAIAISWLTPFCSYSTVPLFLAFVLAGIPLGPAVTFLVVSPMPVESIMMLGALIGTKNPMIFMSCNALAGVLIGVMTEHWNWKRYLQPDLHQISTEKPAVSANVTQQSMCGAAWQEVVTTFRNMWLWLIIGVAMGALLYGYLPAEWFARLSTTHHFISIPIAALIGIPLYANGSSIVPVMEALYLKGISLGAILTFMISTTTLSLPQIVLLKKIFQQGFVWRFVLLLFGFFLLIGWGFSWIIG